MKIRVHVYIYSILDVEEEKKKPRLNTPHLNSINT